jgi:hypothetical protein
MAQPAATDVHLDAILTNIAVAYQQNPANFIATQVFPVVPVDKQSDKYYIFDKQAFLRDSAERRAPSTESAGSGYTLSRDSYFCDVYALHKDISDQVRQNTDNPLNPDRNASQYLMQQILLRQEIQFVSDYMKTGVWGTDKVGATDFTQWDNYATSDPITDIESAKEQILSQTGFMPNTMVLGYQVFRRLKHHPDIVDRIKYTSEKTVTADMLGAIFEIPRVLVAQTIKATNLEGETAAYTFNFGKNALLTYSAPAPGLEVPSAGYVFMWKGVSGSMGLPAGVSRFRMEWLKSDRVEIEAGWNNKVVGTDLGYFLSAAVS